MAKRSREGTFGAIRRIPVEDYQEADERWGMEGTVIPSAIRDGDPKNSGVRFDVHAKKMNGTNLVIEKDGNLQTIHVPARAMEILRINNKNGKRMNYAQAMDLAREEERLEKAKGKGNGKTKEEEKVEEPASYVPPNADTGVEEFITGQRKSAEAPKPEPEPTTGVENLPAAPEGPPVAVVLPIPEGQINRIPPPSSPSGLTPVATPLTEEEPEYMKAQQAEKPGKTRKGRKTKAGPAAPPSPKVPVQFASPLGSVGIMAERVFIGGPNGICLVIIQYSPEGHFYIPPQTSDPVTVSFDGKVYKCLTGIYYQIPGTAVMHTVYFIKE